MGDRSQRGGLHRQGIGNSSEIIGIDDTTGKKTWGYTDKAANRLVPDVTAAFHGIVYGQTEAQPVLLDAATGNDVPTSEQTPSNSTTPSDGGTPSEGATPTDASSPSFGNDPGSANGSDMSLLRRQAEVADRGDEVRRRLLCRKRAPPASRTC